PRLTLPAGETREVLLVLDLTEGAKANSHPTRDFEVHFSPRRGGQAGETEWTVRGKVKAAVRIAQPVVDFGSRSRLAQPLPVQEVGITGLAELAGLSVACSRPELQVEVRRGESDPAHFRLVVTPRAMLPEGAYEGEVSVTPRLASGTALPA